MFGIKSLNLTFGTTTPRIGRKFEVVRVSPSFRRRKEAILQARRRAGLTATVLIKRIPLVGGVLTIGRLPDIDIEDMRVW